MEKSVKSHFPCFSHEYFSNYVDEIINYYRSSELHRIKLKFQSPELKYRRFLVDLMQNICETRRFSRTTLHLGCYFLDVFMDNHTISVNRLNLVAIVCVLLAAKIEDCEFCVPKMTEIQSFINVQYAPGELAAVEKMVIKFFNYQLITPTAASFIETYIEAAVTDSDINESVTLSPKTTLMQKRQYQELETVYETTKEFKNIKELKQAFAMKVFSYLDLSLSSVQLSNTRPSMLAASVIAAARKNLLLLIWPKSLTSLTGYRFADIRENLKMLLELTESLKDSDKNTPDSGYLSDKDISDGEDDVEADKAVNGVKKQCLEQ